MQNITKLKLPHERKCMQLQSRHRLSDI